MVTILTETGLPNVAPGRQDLIGDDALVVNHDNFVQVVISTLDGITVELFDLTAITTFHVLLKRRATDADALAIGSGSVTDVTNDNLGELTLLFPRQICLSADVGKVYWSLSATATTGAYVVPLLYGFAEMRESPLTVVA